MVKNLLVALLIMAGAAGCATPRYEVELISTSDTRGSWTAVALEKTNGIKNRAATLLHLNRTTLVEKIKRHQI